MSKLSEIRKLNLIRSYKNEIKTAIFSSFIKKIAGPNTILFLILQKIYLVLENRFYKLYKALI
jgi:hypothetical protein